MLRVLKPQSPKPLNPKPKKDCEYAEAGEEVTVPAMLPVLSKTPGSTKWAGPDLGQHTEDVLRDLLQMTETEFKSLRALNVI